MLAYAHYLNDARIKSYVRTLEDCGCSVDVIALRSNGESRLEVRPIGNTYRIMDKYQGQSTVMYGWSYFRFFLKAFILLSWRSLSCRYQVVHVHNMPNALVFAAIVPRLFGARLILDVHDLMTVNYMAKFSADEMDLRIQVLEIEQRLSALFADHIVCADHNQGDYLAARCGVSKKKITVLMNLPNERIFASRPQETPVGNGAFRIVYHGTIAHRLGIDLILRAMERVVDGIPAELWMYGAGDYLPEALALTSQLGLEGQVHFNRQFFPVEQIPEIVCGMDLGIIGNRRNLACDQYMLPVKLLEYVYLGVPVIAPRLAVIQRYFDDTMIRFYEPENVEQLAASIVELYHDREERERLARSASSFYQQHNIKAQAEQYLDLLTESSDRLCIAPERHT